MNNYLSVGVKSESIWPREEINIRFDGHELILRPATKDSEKSVHINLKGISRVGASTLINRFLSILSWCDRTAVENLYGFSGSVVPNSIQRQKPVIVSSREFPFCRDREPNPKSELALALYREGETVNSVPFAFISYFKILNIFWRDRYIDNKNAIIEAIREILLLLKDELVTKRLQELTIDNDDEVPEYLYKSCRCAVAHAYSEPIVDPDDVHDLRRLSEDLKVVRAIAEYLITNELHISRRIFE